MELPPRPEQRYADIRLALNSRGPVIPHDSLTDGIALIVAAICGTFYPLRALMVSYLMDYLMDYLPSTPFNFSRAPRLVVAYPARFDTPGIMTFMVNHDGVVFEKDLGETTAAEARKMKSYNPDAGWKMVEMQ